MTLEKAFAAVASTLIVLTIAALAALLVLQTELHGITTGLGNALESVRIAKQLRVELLETDILVRAGGAQPTMDSHVSALLGLLDGAASHVRTAEEQHLLGQARERIDQFIHATRDSKRTDVGPSLDAAHAALRGLVEHYLALARTERQGAVFWDRVAGAIGLTVAALIVSGAFAFLIWAKRRVLAPLVEMRVGIARFGAHDRTARLLPHGPAELQEVASTFNAMADELARQHEERLAMLGGIAHDLRNPLSVLRVATARFPEERELPPGPQLRAVLSLLRRQVDRLDRMVGDFLDASRIEAGALELHVAEGDLREVAERVVELYRTGEPDRVIALFAPDVPVAARFDPGRLEQALGNLVSNALKYSPSGSYIDVSVSASGDRSEARLAVVDAGIGLSDEELHRIFEPFARVGSLRRRVPGVGLGLAVASKIVMAHGGRIDVSSAPGQGSRFEIRLPGSASVAAASESVRGGAPALR